MKLWNVVKKAQCPSAAIIGMAKNTGKTVTLNYLINAAARESVRLGMTSIGRDGEMWDVLNFKEKPAIIAYEGTLLATAEKTLAAATAGVEVLEGTDADTPLGPVLLVRVKQRGRVELAGPSTVKQLLQVKECLRSHGAGLVLVDGALDRQSFAAPGVTEGCILAAGAALGGSMDAVVETVRQRVEQFTAPAAAPQVSRYCRAGQVTIIHGNGQVETYPNSLVFTGGTAFWRQFDSVQDIVFSGALFNSTLENIAASGINLNGLTIIVRDATRLFAGVRMIDKYYQAGGKIQVINSVKLLALTLNSTSPEGEGFNDKQFYQAVAEAVPGVPVYDLIAGLGSEADVTN